MQKLTKKMQAQFAKMLQTGKLYKSSMGGREVWELYLGSFDKKDNPKFRDPQSSTHNCNHCNNFVRRYGNIVAIDKNNKLMTIFDVKDVGEYENSVKAVSKKLKSKKIANVFVETFNNLKSLPYEACKKTNTSFKLGVEKNTKQYSPEEAEKFGVVKAGEIVRFHHLFLDIPKEFVSFTSESIESIQAVQRSNYDVFKRGMEELSIDSLNLVKELGLQGSLLDIDAHLWKVDEFIKLKEIYDDLPKNQKDNWCWKIGYNHKLAKFRNELIGVMVSDLSEGKDLNTVVREWNYRVDPINFMKAKAPVSKAQREKAEKTVKEKGYYNSLFRRFANLDDIRANEIKFLGEEDGGKIEEVSIFDKVQTKSTPTRHKKSQFDGIETIGIEKFMKDILPTCSAVEVFLENKHENNFVNLTTSKIDDSKLMFGWNNPFSWTYKNNLAGKSRIKDEIKLQGGDVDGVLNFRLAWNENGGNDNSDLDVWCSESDGGRIGYSTGYIKGRSPGRSPNSGQLDVDNRNPNGKIAVENITYNDKSKMSDGVYKVWVNQYSARNSQGFTMEIEFDGETFVYQYKQPVVGNIQVAEVTLKNGEFSINHILTPINVSKEIYGLETKKFHDVEMVCLSPNHWGENKVGNKHYFFMLRNCKADGSIRGFHPENLNSDLKPIRKTLDYLANTIMIEPKEREKQLAGIGFNSSMEDEVILKLSGSFKRTIKVKF